MKITFWGAARTVTGSMHEVRVDGRRFLLDCGLYQGRRAEAAERNSRLPFPASSMDGVVLSHAHIDHSGNLPSLAKNGYSGPVYATDATADLCNIMLQDSAHLQERDAEYLNKRHRRRKALDPALGNGEIQPIYTVADAENVMKLFEPVPLYAPKELAPGFTVEAFDAGHILGSSTLVFRYEGGGGKIRLAFSGDVGRPNQSIVRDPDSMPPVDYVIMESTYGDRLHQDVSAVSDKLCEVVNRTCQRGGKVIAPAFAVGRTQQIVLLLHELMEQQRIPRVPVFVDSPLAVEATKVFRKHAEFFDDETREFLLKGEDPFAFPSLRYVPEVSGSKALNDLRGPFIVLSASGMCEAGRILHHLKNNISDARNTVLITGFMAENTLGRKIVDKWQEVPIFGEPIPLRAEVVKLNELSGHADQRELLQWLKPMAKELKKVFLVHGEPAQSSSLAEAIRMEYGLDCVIPSRGDSVELT
jgi:metallo-beta-lactamase family protein